ncbi:hypothetical protein RIR_jg19019.t1 [Rhizophagus irregularis DAOM 181602=DAOM 197198]|uniref:Uncharacterized protein n=1 Tax=Rhizophagus irregularis (strain DAOM 181602 / DAOM 197198 / MUCL 43194) TaxID=747089 RepID=U9U0L4_RHIID|nr:hypothetical protein RIR_jg19019.t1 [Rhizophagus irregularis DAOM 181602=DAOM 197198]
MFLRKVEFFGLAMDRNSSKFRFIENTYGSELFPKACELSFVRVVHGACRIMVNNERKYTVTQKCGLKCAILPARFLAHKRNLRTTQLNYEIFSNFLTLIGIMEEKYHYKVRQII